MRKSRFVPVLAGICISALAFTTSAADLFLKVEGIEGGSIDPKHVRWSDLTAISGDISEGVCGELIVEKPLDKATVKYMEKAFNAELIPKVEIEHVEVKGREEKRVTTVRIEINQAQIAKVETSADEGPLMEYLTIVAYEVKFTFTEYDEDGNRAGNVETVMACADKKK